MAVPTEFGIVDGQPLGLKHAAQLGLGAANSADTEFLKLNGQCDRRAIERACEIQFYFRVSIHGRIFGLRTQEGRQIGLNIRESLDGSAKLPAQARPVGP